MRASIATQNRCELINGWRNFKIQLTTFTLAIVTLSQSTTAAAAEVEVRPDGPTDWRTVDRIAWSSLSYTLTKEQLPLVNTRTNRFVSAAIYNTINNRPEEYVSQIQRNAYYDWVSYALERHQKIPGVTSADDKIVNGIRFFHAANIVTNQFGGLAAIDTRLAKCVFVVFCMNDWFSLATQEDTKALRRINAVLFAKNMTVISRLLNTGIHNPSNPSENKPPSPLDFDRLMVEFEQRTIQELLPSIRLEQSAQQRINRSTNLSLSYKSWGLNLKAYLSAVGIGEVDFFSYNHRVAVGLAYVARFHNISVQQYVNDTRSRFSQGG